MQDIYSIRRANLRKLIEQWGGPTSLAAKLGHSSASYLAQLAGPNPSREVSEKVARSIEVALSLPAGWMDKRQPASQGKRDEVNPALLTKIVSAANEEISSLGIKLPPEKFAELVSLVYELSNEKGAVNAALLRRLIHLAR